MILKRFLKHPKSDPRDFYKMDSYKKSFNLILIKINKNKNFVKKKKKKEFAIGLYDYLLARQYQRRVLQQVNNIILRQV